MEAGDFSTCEARVARAAMHLLSPLSDSELCATVPDTQEMLTEHLLKEKGKVTAIPFSYRN